MAHCKNLILLLLPFFWPGNSALSQDKKAPEGAAADLALTKQAEVQGKLKTLEEIMERLARLLQATEPQNAVKLRTAFQASRERLLREGMDRVLEFLKEKKWDRAGEDQKAIAEGLNELLAILLEKDIDPRELIRHIRKLRDIVKALDRVQQEESQAQLASEAADAAARAMKNLSANLAQLEELIRKQKDLEKETRSLAESPPDPGDASGAARRREQLRALAPRQAKVRSETAALRESTGAKTGAGGSEGAPAPAGESASPSPGGAASLSRAESAMGEAAKAMESGSQEPAQAQAAEARKRLEEARQEIKEQLERLRARSDLARLKKEQEEIRQRAGDVAGRMKETPPLIYSPEGGVPGRKAIEQSAASMSSAADSLAGENPGVASRAQKEATAKIEEGRQQAEEALEELQKALRDRLLAYLRERCAHMLDNQRQISKETRSLDARLRALKAANAESPRDRKDLQRAEDLSRREGALAVVALDVMDLLEEDGTTLAFPQIVQEVKNDLESAQRLLARIETGLLTQAIQKDIERALEDILAALEQAQRSPPPPDPNKGRDSKNGTGPLLPASAELKMVRAMQLRVNQRTKDFDLNRASGLSLEEKRQAEELARRQREVEELLKKMARRMGE